MSNHRRWFDLDNRFLGLFVIFASPTMALAQVPCPPPSSGCPSTFSDVDCPVDHATLAGDCACEGFLSQCWMTEGLGVESYTTPEGFPLNINLWQGFGQGDFPPRSTEPYSSSLPLVSKEVSHFAASSPYAKRPMHNGIVDLITGQPLLQAVDFELPFGGATFRHVRTYSENTNSRMLEKYTDNNRSAPASGAFWDWNGIGWMMSENPILLIDAQWDILRLPERRCYFIPDAHHAIPFVQLGDTGEYVAPTWFDAVLQHNGSGWDSDTKQFAAVPTEFYVWLSRRSVKYTFQPYYEDLWNRSAESSDGLSVHEPGDPNDGEAGGVPYYGLVTKLEDRYGNWVEYEYCHQHRFTCEPASADPCCETCCQNCNEKGQIKSIKLHEASLDEVVWTLYYTHRAFRSNHGNDAAYQDLAYLSHHALHSIHVYPGDVPLLNEQSCLTLEPLQFCNAESLDTVDSIEHAALPPGWVKKVQYVYSEDSYNDDYLGQCAILASYDDWLYSTCVNSDGARLLKVTTTEQSSDDPPAVAASDQLYGYRGTGGQNSARGCVYLSHVYGPSSVQTIVNALRGQFNDPTLDVNDALILVDEHGDVHPSEGGPCYEPGDLADLVIDEFDSYEAQSKANSLSVNRDLISDYIQPLHPELAILRGEVTGSVTDSAGTYNYYFYTIAPDEFPNTWEPFESSSGSVAPTIYRHPYRFGDISSGNVPPLYYFQGDATTFVAVIDERDPASIDPPKSFSPDVEPDPSDPDVEGCSSASAQVVYDPSIYDDPEVSGLVSRRVVEMNARGSIIRDRTWSFDDNGNGTLESQVGFQESAIFDDCGRIIERRSKGWDSPANDATEASDGLIYVYTYDDPSGFACPQSGSTGIEGSELEPGEIRAIGIKRGSDPANPVYYLQSFEHTAPGRPELITKQTAYPIPVTDPASTAGDVVTTSYVLEDPQSTECDGFDCAITEQMSLSPLAPAEMGGTELYSFLKMSYDENGNEVWRGFGGTSSADPQQTPDMAERFFVVRNVFDEKGRRTAEHFDPLPGSEWELAGEFERKVPTSEPGLAVPLNFTTSFEYDDSYGLVRVEFPNGRESRTVYKQVGEILEQWIYKDVDVSASPFKCYGAVQRTIIEAGEIVQVDQIVITVPDDNPDADGEQYTVVSTSYPQYDESGRMIGVEQESGEDTLESGFVTYGAFGNVDRQKDAAGTITRYIYDELGRLSATYRGTSDEHEFWGTGDPQCMWDCYSARYGQEDPPGVPNPECLGCRGPEYNCVPEDCESICFPLCYELCYSDDLTLVEKRYYGSGATNADELIEVRNYRDVPNNQYSRVVPNDACEPQPGENGEDTAGWTTKYEYDWRMRPVLVTRRDAEGRVFSFSVTWYDNLDRARFSAEYGTLNDCPTPSDCDEFEDVAADAPDPRDLNAASGLPPVSDILTSGAEHLLSLTETIYNARGLTEEMRTYDVLSGANPEYTATLNYYDHGNRPTETRSPGSPIRQSVYDARGRQIVSRTLAAGVELTRTDTTYDKNDRATQTVRWERRHDGTESVLDTSNAIASYTHTWYDPAGRVTATADFGTNNEENAYTNGTAPAYATASPAVYEYDPITNDDVLDSCTLDPQTYGNDVHITCYDYDTKGRQSLVWHPDGTKTQTHYDDFGRMVMTVENADDLIIEPCENCQQGPTCDDCQITAYHYDDQQRLDKIAAVMPEFFSGTPSYDQIDWNDLPADGKFQITDLDFDAIVVDSNISEISANGGWISGVRYPDPATGLPSEEPDEPDLAFTYYSNGSVATRTDARGIVMTFTLDELDRVTEVAIDDSAWYDPVENPGPAQRIQRLAYEYTDLSELARITAFTLNEDVVAESLFEYDSLRHLVREFQQHGTAVNTSTSPSIEYDWAFSPVDEYNFDRLAGMIYPVRPTATSRTVTYHYGNDVDDIDSSASRVTAIDDLELADTLAGYAYAGTSRRVGMDFCNGVRQWFTGGGGYDLLDRFGRVSELAYRSPAGVPIYRFRYGYDMSGNRTYARIKQQPYAGQDPELYDNDRSWLYSYDALQRLTSAGMGVLNSANNGLETASGFPTPRQTEWSLDNLGNWSGDDASLESVVTTGDFDGDGQLESDERDVTHHSVDARNRITDLFEDAYAQVTIETVFIHDPAGNLVSDGTYYYQYDAWGRLAQINEIIANGENATVLDEETGQWISGDLGLQRVHYVYDGLGRLIQRRGPTAMHCEGDVDGNGVVDENDKNDILAHVGCTVGAGDAECNAADANWNGAVTTGDANYVQSRYNGSTGGCPDVDHEEYYYDGLRRIQDVFELDDASNTRLMEREYIYGPDDLDEVLFQIDRNNKVLYSVLDANLNVVAILNHSATPMAQYTYDPYGQVLTLDKFFNHPVNRIGHQGLFFERLFDSATTPTAGVPVLTPGAQGFYLNRNRTYDPSLGRFLQADPHASALPMLISYLMSGSNPALDFMPFDLQGHYGDGMNLYQYVRSNPITGRDPLGLDMSDDEIDDQIAEVTGSRLYALGSINEGAKWAAIGLNTALDIAWGFLPGSQFVDAFKSLQLIANGQGGFFDAMNIVTAALPVAGLAMDAIGGQRAFGKARKLAHTGCSCFVAGTLVTTSTGLRPIEQIRPGDCVESKHEASAASQPEWSRVTSIIQHTAEKVRWVTLADDSVVGVTPDHQVSECERGWIEAAEILPGDILLTSDGDAVQVVDTADDDTSVPVYTLEVDGTSTFYASHLWVHNAKLCHIWSEQKWNKLVGEAYQDWVLGLQGLTRNRTSLNIGGSNFVPDFLDEAAGIIGDVKNAENISLTGNLALISQWARNKGIRPKLIYSESKVQSISKNVRDAFDLIPGP